MPRARAIRRAPSDEVRVAVVGLRGRGHDHIEGLRKLAGVRIVALCDVDQDVLERERARLAAPEIGLDVQGYRDLRKLLDEVELEAISIATPNHWHALQAIWACRPARTSTSRTRLAQRLEGRQIVKAARKHERIVAVGTQCRSSQAIADAIRWLHEGHLGRIQLARGSATSRARRSARSTDRKTVAGIGRLRAVDRSGADEAAAPQEPALRLALGGRHRQRRPGQPGHPPDGSRALGARRERPGAGGDLVGGRLGYDDDGDTPNTQLALHIYPRAPLLFEVRGLPRDAAAQKATGARAWTSSRASASAWSCTASRASSSSRATTRPRRSTQRARK
jgi:hypothetical protein